MSVLLFGYDTRVQESIRQAEEVQRISAEMQARYEASKRSKRSEAATTAPTKRVEMLRPELQVKTSSLKPGSLIHKLAEARDCGCQVRVTLKSCNALANVCGEVFVGYVHRVCEGRIVLSDKPDGSWPRSVELAQIASLDHGEGVTKSMSPGMQLRARRLPPSSLGERLGFKGRRPPLTRKQARQSYRRMLAAEARMERHEAQMEMTRSLPAGVLPGGLLRGA